MCWRRAAAVRVMNDITGTCFNELFVTAHVDNILNTDSNK